MKLLTASTITLMVARAEAIMGKQPPVVPDPHVVDSFVWSDPFDSASIASYEVLCQATASFPALEYTLVDLTEPPPKGLKPWSGGLKKFFTGSEYPGGWSGIDVHGPSRSLLMMEYRDVPIEVKAWIEEREPEDDKGNSLFAVLQKPTEVDSKINDTVDVSSPIDRALDENKIMVFAPGAIYHILPLWVAGGSDCQDELTDLSSFSPQPGREKVVAWLDHEAPKEKEMRFHVKAQVLKEQAVPQESTRQEL